MFKFSYEPLYIQYSHLSATVSNKTKKREKKQEISPKFVIGILTYLGHKREVS